MTEIDQKYEDSKFEIVDVFEYRGRTCVIIRVNFMVGYDGYYAHNGYVSFRPKSRLLKLLKRRYEKEYSKYEYLAEDGLTYDGYLGREWRKSNDPLASKIPEDLYFFGFDTLHSWNDAENASYEVVKQKTLNMADNMISMRI